MISSSIGLVVIELIVLIDLPATKSLLLHQNAKVILTHKPMLHTSPCLGSTTGQKSFQRARSVESPNLGSRSPWCLNTRFSLLYPIHHHHRFQDTLTFNTFTPYVTMQFLNTPSLLFAVTLLLPTALAAPAPAQLYLLESDAVSRPKHISTLHISGPGNPCWMVCFPEKPACGNNGVSDNHGIP
jgi:hypothetical protein